MYRQTAIFREGVDMLDTIAWYLKATAWLPCMCGAREISDSNEDFLETKFIFRSEY